jgi:5'-AMP-activated protein kinase, regulatory beta subunit
MLTVRMGGLVQVILNAETADATDPTVVPTPDHVMLGHLYALSIRDGVMVLAATSRYKQKYVTSILYRPVPALPS